MRMLRMSARADPDLTVGAAPVYPLDRAETLVEALTRRSGKPKRS